MAAATHSGSAALPANGVASGNGVRSAHGAARAAASAKAAARPGTGRLSGATLVIIGAVAGIVALVATNQILPATSAHQAEIRFWLGARAAGLTALLLMTVEVTFGLVLSHPTNKSTWKLSKRLFPWHEHAFVFTIAFVVIHGAAIAVDRYANVGILGALVPGFSQYRSVPVALGTIALYAMLVTGLTARFTKWLPNGWWLKLHRLGIVVLALAWIHGLTAGTDSPALTAVYVATFVVVALAAAYRYWIVRSARPTFATSLTEERS
ncbi:MAG TPA: hypothetical protein VKR30_00820 [Candidatus Limnocylindrales bacterium]|nr:hypothetical protein [Candidatus Limnocylindrales bacterium]